jgi:hypothetical protein
VTACLFSLHLPHFVLCKMSAFVAAVRRGSHDALQCYFSLTNGAESYWNSCHFCPHMHAFAGQIVICPALG